MDARLERREAGFDEQLVGAFLFHLASAKLQRSRLEFKAQSLEGANAETKHEGDDEAEGEGLPEFVPIIATPNNADELQEQVGDKRADGSSANQHQRLYEQNQPRE